MLRRTPNGPMETELARRYAETLRARNERNTAARTAEFETAAGKLGRDLLARQGVLHREGDVERIVQDARLTVERSVAAISRREGKGSPDEERGGSTTPPALPDRGGSRTGGEAVGRVGPAPEIGTGNGTPGGR